MTAGKDILFQNNRRKATKELQKESQTKLQNSYKKSAKNLRKDMGHLSFYLLNH